MGFVEFMGFVGLTAKQQINNYQIAEFIGFSGLNIIEGIYSFLRTGLMVQLSLIPNCFNNLCVLHFLIPSYNFSSVNVGDCSDYPIVHLGYLFHL